MTEPQTITINGQQAVVISLSDYKRLTERAELATDILDATVIAARLAAGEETFPQDIVDRLVAGESPVRVFREFRGLTQVALANAAGISVPAISKIEAGGGATVATMSAVAERLGVKIDDLV